MQASPRLSHQVMTLKSEMITSFRLCTGATWCSVDAEMNRFKMLCLSMAHAKHVTMVTDVENEL